MELVCGELLLLEVAYFVFGVLVWLVVWWAVEVMLVYGSLCLAYTGILIKLRLGRWILIAAQ